MKKVLALVIAAIMVISMFPVMAITTSAVDVEGMWDTFRGYGSYTETDEETGEEVPAKIYTPAPGYEYTSEGFHTISPSFANCNPYFTINSKEKVNIKDGFYLEIRVDDYSYAGEPKKEGDVWGTADHWLSFHLSTSENINPASNKSGRGWVSLIRHGHVGGGSTSDPENIIAQSFVQDDVVGKPFNCTNPAAKIAPTVDDEGRRIYTFEGRDNGDGTYSISICGVDLSHAEINTVLAGLDPDGTGEFYIGFTMNTTVQGGTAECTITKFGTSASDATVPQGSDTKDADENPNYYADMTDSTTIPEGQPALVMDANKTSWKGKSPSTQYMTMTAQGNGSFKVDVEQTVAYWMWSVTRDVTINSADFPVIAILIEDPNMLFTDGNIRYSTGDVTGADDVHIIPVSIYGDDSVTYGENEDIYLCIVDMRSELTEEEFAEGWHDRFHGLRVESNGWSIDATDTENNFFFMHYTAIFRSVEDAKAYGDKYVAEVLNAEQVTEGEETEAPAGDETEAPAGDETTADAETGAAAGDETTADGAATQAPATTEGGCASVIGVASVILAAAAAAVVLKKRD